MWERSIEIESILRRKIITFHQKRLLLNKRHMGKRILHIIEKINNKLLKTVHFNAI